jgi:hypothetical protein
VTVRRKCLITAVAVVFLGACLCSNGCKESDSQSSQAEQAGNTTIPVCTTCGQKEGSELCCKEGQPKCPKCGLVKGSLGCCKIPKGLRIAAICTECGQVVGGELCCACNQAKCPVEEFAQTHKYPDPEKHK